jgi:glycosyltransferase involved in cell wall biosynthesis
MKQQALATVLHGRCADDGGSDGNAPLGVCDRPGMSDQRQRLRIQRLLKRNRELSQRLRTSERRAEAAERRLKEVKASAAWRYTRILRNIGAEWNRVMTYLLSKDFPKSDELANHKRFAFFDETDNTYLALIVDYRWPRYDQDSGSVDAINLVDALIDCGLNVCFYADTESDLHNDYRSSLESRGVLCLGAPHGMDLKYFLETYAERIRLCVLSRIYAGGNHLELVQLYCTQARIVFNPVDLHFLREERQALLSGNADASAAAATTRARELRMFNEADATIVVSTAEQELLERLDPGAHVVYLPLARPIITPRAQFEERSGIGFVGGFEHAPNLDAIRFFLSVIWPLVREKIPDCEFSIVGRGLDRELLRGVGPEVRYLGHVPDIAAWLETLRLTVAPLRFGAGAKGKIASSLASGVPCVATKIAVEGMGLDNSQAVLLADTPDSFAERIQLVHSDGDLWRRLSAAGVSHAREALSVVRYRRGVATMLAELGLAASDA